MRQPLVAGNWKMNGSLDSVTALVEGIKAGIDAVTTAEMAVCPPYVFIPQVAIMLAGTVISYGAQDVSDQEAGAYTGEVAPGMLFDVGCKYAIVGHSERRSLYGESDEFTARKFASAQNAGLVPILCVGELLEEREQGITEQVVARQLDAVICLRTGLGHRHRQDGDPGPGAGSACVYPRQTGRSRRGSRGQGTDPVRRQHEPGQCGGTAGHAGYRRRPDRRCIAEAG